MDTIGLTRRKLHRGVRPLLGALAAVVAALACFIGFARPVFAAFPIPNVGGIVLTASAIDGNFIFAASSSQTDLQSTWPTARISGTALTFPNGFTLIKTVDVSATPLAAEGISKVIFEFQVAGVRAADNATFQVSGIESDQTNFTTGYDNSGNPVMMAKDGTQQPLADVSNIQTTQLTNAALNLDSMNLSDFDWTTTSLQVIVVDSNGNPLPAPNGSFSYDSTYDTTSS